LHARKLAAVAELAAGAGHEINNPLAVISGQAQYVLRLFQALDGPADEIEDVGEYLDHLRGSILPSVHKIIGQTGRIRAILTDLMQFARPTPPRAQPVRLGELLRQAADAVNALAEERGVRLVCRLPDGDPVLNADPAQLRTALTSLLRNAVEAAPPEGWAGVRAEPGRDGALDVVVEDNGPGPATREHLFDPFYCGRSAGRGRGMGLPTAWRLARLHGGDVRYDGRPDGVTRFVLSLPVPAEPPAFAGPEAPHPHAPLNGSAALAG
jgi:signal transduction histidine kinase